MKEPQYADVEFRPRSSGFIGAWSNGKYLGHVVTDGKNVSVVLSRKVLLQADRNLRKRRTGGFHSGEGKAK